jgi:hypothetical protein
MDVAKTIINSYQSNNQISYIARLKISNMSASMHLEITVDMLLVLLYVERKIGPHDWYYKKG